MTVTLSDYPQAVDNSVDNFVKSRFSQDFIPDLWINLWITSPEPQDSLKIQAEPQDSLKIASRLPQVIHNLKISSRFYPQPVDNPVDNLTTLRGRPIGRAIGRLRRPIARLTPIGGTRSF